MAFLAMTVSFCLRQVYVCCMSDWYKTVKRGFRMRQHFLDEHTQAIVDMIALEKASAADIAKRYGTTRNLVIGWARRRDIRLVSPNGRRAPAVSHSLKLAVHKVEILARFEAAFNKQRQVHILSARFGASAGVIRHFLRDNGIDLTAIDPKPRNKSEPIGLPKTYVPAGVEGVPFLETGPEHCKYPLWQGDDKIGNVCGRPVVEVTVKDRTRRLSWCCDCLKRVAAPRQAVAA